MALNDYDVTLEITFSGKGVLIGNLNQEDLNLDKKKR